MNLVAFRAVSLLLLAGFVLYVFVNQMRKKKPNAMVWHHPDHKGGVDFCRVEQESALAPWKVEWDFFGLVKRDIWMWYEDKVQEVMPGENLPEVPAESNEDSYLYCKCGFKQPKDKQRLMDMHLMYGAKKGDKTLFDQTHSPMTVTELRKEATKRIVEAQKEPLMKTTYILKPYEPKPAELAKVKVESEVRGVESEVRGAREKPKEPITSPNSLWDTTNWQCAVRFGTIPSKIKEAIKLGIGIGMFAICCIALIMIIDMVQKGQTI